MRVTSQELNDAVVVRVAGALGTPTARDLRDALLKASTQQPIGVVCDLRAAEVHRSAITVLLVVADQLARWPACPLAVVTTEPALIGALDRAGVTRRVTVAATVSAALAGWSTLVRPVRATLRLPPDVAAPARAREFLNGLVDAWALPERDAAAALLVLDELVTNAVVHAGTELDVLVSRRGGRLRIAVADGSPTPPTPRRATSADENGRGLALIDALTSRWGVVPRGATAGKVVWAVLDVDAGEAAEAVSREQA